MNHSLKHFFFLVAIGLFLWSCSDKKPSRDEKKTQVKGFAFKIQEGLMQGRVGILDLHFDKQAFVNRVTNDAFWDEELKKLGNETYKPEYKTQLLRELTLAGMFLSGVDGKSYFAYDSVKTYRIEDRWHAVFRMYANGAINYHDYILRVDSNKVWIEDVYVMTIGKRLSLVMQEAYVAGIPDANNYGLHRDQQLLLKAKYYLDNAQHQRSLATFDSISFNYRNQKSMRLFRLQILSNIPNEQYVRELEKFEAEFPNEAGTILLQMDKNFLYGNYPAVLKNIARLEAMYGKDPVLTYMEANAQNLLGKCALAGTLYQEVLTSKPDWEMPAINWINCLLKENKYQKAIGVIEQYKSNFAFTPTYVKYLFKEQTGFLISTEFKEWKTQQDP